MKRKLFCFLLLALVLLLSGCNRNAKVGICIAQGSDSLSAEYAKTLNTALTDAGYRVTVADAGEDQAKQTRQVDELLQSECDLLIVEPVMTDEAQAIAQKAKQAGVPVIFINREPEQAVLDSWRKLCYIGADPQLQQAGSLQWLALLSTPNQGDLNGDGIVSYAVLAGPEDHMDALALTQGCATVTTQSDLALSCLETDFGTWDSGQERCARLLAKYGKDMEVLLCNSDLLMTDALDAIADGGRTVGEDLYLVGFGGSLQTRLLIRSEDITGTVGPDIPGLIHRITDTAQRLLSGRSMDQKYYVNHIVLTADNVEQYLPN